MGNCFSTKFADADINVSSPAKNSQKQNTMAVVNAENHTVKSTLDYELGFPKADTFILSSQDKAKILQEWKHLESLNCDNLQKTEGKEARDLVNELRGKKIVAIVKGKGWKKGIHDGDTITIIFRNKGKVIKHNVRFARLDTPEVSKESQQHCACGKLVRKVIVNNLEKVKRRVLIQVPDCHPDRYNRLLADIFLDLDNPWCLNDWMIAHKIAKPYHNRRSEWTSFELQEAQKACEKICPSLKNEE